MALDLRLAGLVPPPRVDAAGSGVPVGADASHGVAWIVGRGCRWNRDIHRTRQVRWREISQVVPPRLLVTAGASTDAESWHAARLGRVAFVACQRPESPRHSLSRRWRLLAPH